MITYAERGIPRFAGDGIPRFTGDGIPRFTGDGKLVGLPKGKASRRGRRWICGYGKMESAKAVAVP